MSPVIERVAARLLSRLRLGFVASKHYLTTRRDERGLDLWRASLDWNAVDACGVPGGLEDVRLRVADTQLRECEPALRHGLRGMA